MKRIPLTLLSVVVASSVSGCATSGGPIADDEMAGRQFVGGWDAEGSSGTAILLLRDGFIGTLNITSLHGAEMQYHLRFDVEGELDEESLLLSLNCAEARQRDPDAEDGDEADASDAVDPTPGEVGDAGEPTADPEDDPPWDSVDCAGWDLDLQCSLAGECDSGDCNMVCDVIYFGDAYAHSQVELGSVEDAFDYWQRV